MDNEQKGEGTQYDYGFRIYDPRIGKFLSLDPLTNDYPMLTPFQFASNSPISGVDLDGLEFYYAANGEFLGKSINGKGNQLRIATKYTISKSGNVYITNYTEYKTNSDVSRKGRNESGTFTGIRTISNDELGRILAYGNEVFTQKMPEHTTGLETVYNESIGRRDFNGDYGLLDFKHVVYDLLDVDKGNLLEINGVVYNPNEAGNFLWGMVLAYNDIPGAEKIADLGSPNNQDEPHDKKAIKEGDKFGEVVDEFFSAHPFKKAMSKNEANGQSKSDYAKIKAIQDAKIEEIKDANAEGFAPEK